ncbi:MAG TPA: HAMP domain-containing sensor histidine kinase [Gemmatimonadaceae bacterium]|nr:HAMP domain-containing sensor histidine kinase [Gemmatimonadaceae bacterium]
MGVFALMVGGLLVADHALTRADRSQAEIDATQSALVVQQMIATQVARLDAFAIVFASTPQLRAQEFSALARSFTTPAVGARSVWLIDSSRSIELDTAFVPMSAGAALRAQARAAGIADALGIGQPVLRLAGNAGGSRELVLVAPLTVQGRPAGVAGAEFDAAQLFEGLLRKPPPTRSQLMLLAGSDTIVTWKASETHFGGPGRVVLDVPSTTHWQIVVAHAQASQGLRITLWVLGLVAVLFLGIGVFRERRQALRVSERSAELERLSSELLRANRMKSEFLANVSHELRTPLNAIVGFVDLLRDGVYGDLSSRQIPPVDRIAASATHLRHLVDQVLDIAKIAAGRLEVHSETVVLRPFVLNVASELEPLIAERGLNLSLAVGASLPRVHTDPTHLRQILVNLIGNAVKYTTNGGIAVRARLVGSTTNGKRPSLDDPTLLARAPDRRRTWIALQVIDTGIGIAPADQERIFDEFEQVNAGPRGDSMHRGTGLGLAISRRLARLLGGEIGVESQLGKGSTFTVWLPVSIADVPGPELADGRGGERGGVSTAAGGQDALGGPTSS